MQKIIVKVQIRVRARKTELSPQARTEKRVMAQDKKVERREQSTQSIATTLKVRSMDMDGRV